jgi:uncharacterized membrane protein YbhN (UPF0104 family)
LLEIKQEGLAWIAFGLPVVACLPIVPGVFNRVAALLSRPFLAKDAAPLPKLRFATLLGGLAQTSLGWFCLGASLLCLLRGLGMPPLSWSTCTACVALSYVAGFVTVIVPGGLGVREELLQLSLAAEFIALRPDEPEQKTLAIVAALVLRLVWTVTELALAGGSALLPRLLPRKTSA